MLLPGISQENRVVPGLHLLLGVGNHLSQGFNKDLEELDNKDPVALAKARELRDVIAELEAFHAKKFSILAAALDDADVKVAEENEDECSKKEDDSAQENCRLAFEAATDAALELRVKADVYREGDPTRAVRSRSKRQVAADEKAAEGLEESALALELLCEEARAAAIALDDAKDEYNQLTIQSTISGRLVGIYNGLLIVENIEKQVYWNGQLVGPHLWRFLLRFAAIFAALREKAIALSYPAEPLDKLIARYSPALEALASIAPLMRATRLLSAAELDLLETNCAELGRIWREEFAAAHGGEQTPKVHLIERHVAEQARRHGTLGMFGEEGGEAVHPAMTLAAQLCRAIKNPQARLLATKRHIEAKQRAKLIPHVKKSRMSKKKRQSLAAGAAPDAVGGK